MGRIDEPLDQIEFLHRDEGGEALSVSLTLGAEVIGLLNPALGALAAVTAFVREFRAEHRERARAQALIDGLREGLGSIEGRLDSIEDKVGGPDATEAFTVALRHALGSTRLDKARMFGRILGATINGDAPNWEEAAEFIRTLEEFNREDLEALKILWVVQRTAHREITAGSQGGERRGMSTNANDYTSKWTGVLDRASKAGMSRDDWEARCARLSGFGLTALVQPNSSYQGPDSMCYRLTGRAVRLLGLLGQNANPRAYPAVRYHATLPPVTVNDEDEDRALGSGWADTPAAFQTQSAR